MTRSQRVKFEALLLNWTISSSAKILYLYLCLNSNSVGFSTFTNRELSATFQVSTRSIQNQLRELKTSGLIRLESGTGGEDQRAIFPLDPEV